MKTVASLALVLICTATVATAQTEGRVGVGGSVTYVHPTDENVNPVVTVGPLVRLNPKPGWGIAAALNWYEADLEAPFGAGGDLGKLRVRPLMGGVSYSIATGALITSFSVVAGPSFNRVRIDDDYRNRLAAAGTTIDVDTNTSFAIRPGVGLTYTLAPRVGLVGFGGYMINRPDITARLGNTVFSDTWKADAVVLSVGLVYSLF